MNNFYTHDSNIECTKCSDIDDCQFTKNNETSSINSDGWNLNNNPAYWGSSTPKVLVLGYSKGATQMKQGIKFNNIAFKGMRDRLRDILLLLKLVDKDVKINDFFEKNTGDFGFASLIRCGISYKGKTSGPLISKSFNSPATKEIITNCVDTFFTDKLPKSVETIIFLGSSKIYKKKLSKHFANQFDNYRHIDDDSFFLGNVKCLFVAHPSPANGHFKKWLINNKEIYKKIS